MIYDVFAIIILHPSSLSSVRGEFDSSDLVRGQLSTRRYITVLVRRKSAFVRQSVDQSGALARLFSSYWLLSVVLAPNLGAGAQETCLTYRYRAYMSI